MRTFGETGKGWYSVQKWDLKGYVIRLTHQWISLTWDKHNVFSLWSSEAVHSHLCDLYEQNRRLAVQPDVGGLCCKFYFFIDRGPLQVVRALTPVSDFPFAWWVNWISNFKLAESWLLSVTYCNVIFYSFLTFDESETPFSLLFSEWNPQTKTNSDQSFVKTHGSHHFHWWSVPPSQETKSSSAVFCNWNY